MKATLEDIIQSIFILPEHVLEDVIGHFQHLEYPKNYYLHKSDKTCNHIWFMTKGSLGCLNIKTQEKQYLS